MTSTKKFRWLKRLGMGAVVVSTTVALVACSGGSGKDSSSAGAKPERGGSVTVVSAGPVTTWDPTVQAPSTLPGVANDRYNAIYGVLIYVDASGDVKPSIAQSLTTKDDTVWTLTLNSGVQFSDGTPLDAAAVKFNWDRAAGAESAQKALASTFTSEVVNDTTLKVTLTQPNPVFDRQVAEQLQFILSPKSVKDQGDKYTKPIGAGPFILKSTDPAVGEDLVRNPDYFEKGKPYLDALHFKNIADPAQRVTTVAQGGADIMNNYKFALLDALDTPGTATYPVKAGGIRHFVFNTTTAPFNDVRARKAAALAVDPKELTQTLTQDPDEKGWTSLFAKSSPNYNAKYAVKENDPKAATKLVDEVKADGVDTTVRIVAAAVPEITRAAELLQIELKKVGFTVKIDQVPLADWATQVRDRDDFQITFYPGIFDLNNAPVAFTSWMEGPDNISNYSSPELTSAMQAARDAKTAADQTKAFATVQELFQKNVWFVPFGIDERLFFQQDSVKGMTPVGRGMLLTADLYRTDLSKK